jgi:hypothetical protein
LIIFNEMTSRLFLRIYLDKTSRLFLQRFILNLIRTDYTYEEQTIHRRRAAPFRDDDDQLL